MDVILAMHAADPALILRNCHRLDARAFECELYVRSSGFIAERQFWFEEMEQMLRFAFTTDQTVLAPFAWDLAQLATLQPPNDH